MKYVALSVRPIYFYLVKYMKKLYLIDPMLRFDVLKNLGRKISTKSSSTLAKIMHNDSKGKILLKIDFLFLNIQVKDKMLMIES